MPNAQIPISKYKYDIHERTYKFALNIVKFTRRLPRSIESQVIIKQIIRSSTSICANLQEADGSKTRQEFRHSVSISKKEAKETYIWLRFISDLYPTFFRETQKYLDECEEITRILATIIIKTKT